MPKSNDCVIFQSSGEKVGKSCCEIEVEQIIKKKSYQVQIKK